MTPAQRLMVACWQRLHAEWERGTYFLPPVDGDPYGTIDHAVARELGVRPEQVDEAMVLAGRRPPVSWIG